MASSDIATWVPRAISAVSRLTRPARASCTRRSSSGQRAGAGAVGDDQADALAVEVGRGQLLEDERADLARG